MKKKLIKYALLLKNKFSMSDSVVSFSDNRTQILTSNDINVHGFTVMMAGKILLQDANLTLVRGRRYGLVGYNGCGKTTLLRLLATQKENFKIAPHIDVLYVEQEVIPSEKSALQTVLESDVEREKLLLELNELNTEDNFDRINEIYEQLELISSESAKSRASAILSGLQFTEEMKVSPTTKFSGGWRMRISLAKALFLKPRLLLLDEPTNHLDLHACIWLEDYLSKWKNTLLVVSHDRDFLNGVCTDIVHLCNHTLRQMKGDYDQFEKVYRTEKELYIKSWEEQQKLIKKWKKNGKNISDMFKQTNTIKLEQYREYSICIEFHTPELFPSLINVNNISFRYAANLPLLFNKESFGLDANSRIAIVGPNGSGKSTLLKLLSGEIKMTEGTIDINPNIKIGVFSQHAMDQLDLDATPIEYLQRKFNIAYEETRKYLGTIGLASNHHNQQISTLSGGQKARVMIVELQLLEPHVLLLDEPTNNLDMETNNALCNALKMFEGAVVVVTHSMTLISEVCSEIWICDEQKIKPFKGDFYDYRSMMLDKISEK